ncbi:MAG: NIL domain-containing protein [Candidatus Omnitrophica bacterium]|nr:NIL domain-containing protein [Candidatus Omnitrophota bacterium]
MVKKAVLKKVVKLIFPQELIKEPVTFQMAKKYNIIPNIRRAKVTEIVGELVLELQGEEKNIEKGIQYLKRLGVSVKPIEGDVVD